jgi:hypothetical protein
MRMMSASAERSPIPGILSTTQAILSSTVILWADAFISFIMTIQAIRTQKDPALIASPI